MGSWSAGYFFFSDITHNLLKVKLLAPKIYQTFAQYGDVITKFSRMDSLPNFLICGAPRTRARGGSAIKGSNVFVAIFPAAACSLLSMNYRCGH